MRQLLWAVAAVGGMALLSAGAVYGFLAVRYGQFENVPPDHRYACTKITGVDSSEDLAVDWSRRQGFVAVRGSDSGIYRVALGEGLEVRNVTPPGLRVTPGGLSLYKGAGGSRRLFAVNHAGGRPGVAIFDISDEGSLMLVDQITADALYAPNDLVAVGPRQFYVTNSTRLHEQFASLWNKLRVLLDLDTTGDIVYFDGMRFHVAASGVRHPNGINVSPDGAWVYVSQTYSKRVAVFERDRSTNQLALQERIPVPGAADNIDVAPDGAIFVAALPHMLSNVAHVVDENPRRPPGQIVRLFPDRTPGHAARVWSDDGRLITTVTIGAPYARSGALFSYLIGSLSDRHMLSCTPRQHSDSGETNTETNTRLPRGLQRGDFR